MKMTVYVSGASIASTLAYQSFRGFSRSFAGASGASRTTSNVYFTSLDVNALPSCHRTFFLRKTKVAVVVLPRPPLRELVNDRVSGLQSPDHIDDDEARLAGC